MKITIIGTGHGGCAAAAFYTKEGHDVKLLKIGIDYHNENFDFLEKNKTITLTGIVGEGSFVLKDVTKDIDSAISDAEIILLFYVANYHDFVAEKISPFLREDQIVYLCPGYMGSLLIKSQMRKIANKANVIFAEGETLPFSSRIIEAGVVNISSRNFGHPIAFLYKDNKDIAFEKLQVLLGKCFLRKNIIETALHNPNLIMHTIGIIMNTGRIEDPDLNFFMYRQGFTPSIWKVVKELDNEKMNILDKLGMEKRSYFDEFLIRTFGGSDEYSGEEGFKHYVKETRAITKNVNNRYIIEDVPIGLGLLHSLGKHLDFPTPICDSIIHLCGIMLNNNFFNSGRSIESLGFDNIENLKEAVNS